MPLIDILWHDSWFSSWRVLLLGQHHFSQISGFVPEIYILISMHCSHLVFVSAFLFCCRNLKSVFWFLLTAHTSFPPAVFFLSAGMNNLWPYSTGHLDVDCFWLILLRHNCLISTWCLLLVGPHSFFPWFQILFQKSVSWFLCAVQTSFVVTVFYISLCKHSLNLSTSISEVECTWLIFLWHDSWFSSLIADFPYNVPYWLDSIIFQDSWFSRAVSHWLDRNIFFYDFCFCLRNLYYCPPPSALIKQASEEDFVLMRYFNMNKYEWL